MIRNYRKAIVTLGSKTKSIFHQTCKLSAFVLLREMACKTKHLTFYCSYCALNTQNTVYYRPQRTCGKVMFSQASVILFTGGACIPACTGQTPPGRHPTPLPSACWDTPAPPGQTPPCPVHAGIHTPPLSSACWDTSPGGHCSGRYASYWNAFLLGNVITYIGTWHVKLVGREWCWRTQILSIIAINREKESYLLLWLLLLHL